MGGVSFRLERDPPWFQPAFGLHGSPLYRGVVCALGWVGLVVQSQLGHQQGVVGWFKEVFYFFLLE